MNILNRVQSAKILIFYLMCLEILWSSRYNHSADPGENFNLNVTESSNGAVYALSAYLSRLLRAGPSYGDDAASTDATAE